MRAIFIDIENNESKIVDIPDDLKVFYSMLNCRIVEMPMLKIGVKSHYYFNIICDEEALLKGNPFPSAFSDLGKPLLFGNLLITNVDEKTGELASLSVEDCEYIVQFIKPVGVQNKRTGEVRSYLGLTQCEY